MFLGHTIIINKATFLYIYWLQWGWSCIVGLWWRYLWTVIATLQWCSWWYIRENQDDSHFPYARWSPSGLC